MKKALAGTLALAATVFMAAPALGATATSNVAVSATVINNCTITTTPVAFGNYDPLSGAPNNNSGTVVITCTKGAATTVTLGNGNNFNVTRRMISGRELHELRALPAVERRCRARPAATSRRSAGAPRAPRSSIPGRPPARPPGLTTCAVRYRRDRISRRPPSTTPWSPPSTSNGHEHAPTLRPPSSATILAAIPVSGGSAGTYTERQ